MTSPDHDVAPTAAQLRALAHPMRLRILRMCLVREYTNQELAEAMGVAPGTVLRHVRDLLAAGYLTAGAVRTGRRGALERPYRATGTSWRLPSSEPEHPELERNLQVALVTAHLAELHESAVGAERASMRGTMRLDPAALAELRGRVEALLREYGERDDPGGVPVSFLWSIHGVPEAPAAARPGG